MILAYADVSVDDPILAVGYVLYRSRRGDRELLGTGTRILNMRTFDHPIEGPHQGEYYANIVAVRQALDWTTEPIQLHCDNVDVVEAMRAGDNRWGQYYSHALYSFLERFSDYDIRLVHRKNNEVAHEQARIGLKIARDIQSGDL
jgi:hypothetical protein